MDDTRKYQKEKNSEPQHTANFIVSSFILSTRSTKKIYGLNPARIGILRYICDSMDIGKKKVLKTVLYQSQIARHSHIDETNLRPHLKALIRKKFLKYDPKARSFSLGKVLMIWGDLYARIDGGYITPSNDSAQTRGGISPPRIDGGYITPSDRWGVNHPPSNSSNFTNTSENLFGTDKQNQKRNNKPIAMSPLLAEYMKNNGKQ